MTKKRPGTKKPKGIRISESEEQQVVMQWAAMREGQYPELALFHHIPNGGSRREGERAKLAAEGVKPGVPDLHLPVARGKWHGLWIEMKAKDGTPSREQLRWIAMLAAQDNKAVVCYGADQAIREIVEYMMEDKKNDHDQG